MSRKDFIAIAETIEVETYTLLKELGTAWWMGQHEGPEINQYEPGQGWAKFQQVRQDWFWLAENHNHHGND